MPLLMKYSRYFAELALAALGLAGTVPVVSAGAAQDSETPGDRRNRNDTYFKPLSNSLKETVRVAPKRLAAKTCQG